MTGRPPTRQHADGRWRCSNCDEFFPVEEFGMTASGKVNGYCGACRRAYQRVYNLRRKRTDR